MRYDEPVRWIAAIAMVSSLGCVSGGGDTVTQPADAAVDTFSSVDGNIFPVEDSATEDTAPPTCGVAGKPCCTGDACGAGTYCNGALCWALPTAIEEGSDPGACGDLGKTHVAPEFLARYVVKGRPGAKAYRYFVKVSCGSSPPSLTPESPLTIGSDGTYTFTLENTASTDCANANLGRYEVWFVVDGHETTHQFDSVFNSTCPSVSTCAAAATICP